MSDSDSTTSATTRVLQRIEDGEAGAAEELLPLVYDELGCLAHRHRRRLHPGQTLQTTALVHEAWMRMGEPERNSCQSRAHFFGAAALAMRRILIDETRRRHSLRRKAPHSDERAAEPIAGPEVSSVDLLALEAALRRFEQEFPRAASVVMLRYFAGQPLKEIAAILDTTIRTVSRDWEFARTWLHCAIEGRSQGESYEPPS